MASEIGEQFGRRRSTQKPQAGRITGLGRRPRNEMAVLLDEPGEPLDVIIDRADSGDLESVMIAGRLVLDNRKITTIDEEQVIQHINESVARLYDPGTEKAQRWRKLGRDVALRLQVLRALDEAAGAASVPVQRARPT